MSLATTTDRCPHCKEPVHREATRCKHCQGTIDRPRSRWARLKKKLNTFRTGFVSGVVFATILFVLLYFQLR